MVALKRPNCRPSNPCFSSGPCSKRPGWALDVVGSAFLGRSHRAREGKKRLKRAIDETKALLEIPQDYRVGIVPASDTGAFECAMWSLLGVRGVDVFVWESFGDGWAKDVVAQLKIKDVRTIEADYGALPDLNNADFSRDVIFTANGTTSGVRIPDYDWIPDGRLGLTFVDATSAVFAQPVAWEKVDVATFSWQKVMGGEAAHGMLILSPRAVDRLLEYVPPWPLPKVFRLTKGGRLIEGIFEGETINTPSMLCVEDYLDALNWARGLGGLNALMARADRNAMILHDWVNRTDWIENLASDPATYSNTSVCLKIVDDAVLQLEPSEQSKFSKSIAMRLEEEGVAFDINSYRDAPPGLRIWTGATVEAQDVEALLPWLEWAFQEAKAVL